MKQFNLDEFFNNPERKVYTRNGRPVRIICTDAIGDFPVVGLVETDAHRQHAYEYTPDGRISKEHVSDVDLFFSPVMKEGWIITDDSNAVTNEIFPTKDSAEGHMGDYGWDIEGKYRIAKVIWEEDSEDEDKCEQERDYSLGSTFKDNNWKWKDI